MSRLPFPAVLLLTGCISQPSLSSRDEMRTLRLETERTATEMSLMQDDPSTTHPVPASPEAVWEVLPDAYSELGITMGTVDPTQRVYGNRQLQVRNRLGKTPLSRFVDCGSSLSGPNADSYTVTLDVLTFVEEGAGGTTQLRTRLAGTAKPMYNRGNAVACRTTGELEKRIAEAAMKKIQS